MPPERCADGARGARHPRVVYSNLFFACHRLFHSCMPNRPVLVQRIIVVQLCRHYGAYFEERALSQSERCTFSKNLHFSSPQLTATFVLYMGKGTGTSTTHIFAEQALGTRDVEIKSRCRRLESRSPHSNTRCGLLKL